MDYTEQPSIQIQSISDLVTALSEEERTTYKDILQSMNIGISEFERYCSWSDICYTRNCIEDNENFELILLCWEKGQSTPIHDHGGEECWVKVLDGKFKEAVYKKNELDYSLTEVSEAISEKGDITYMIDFKGVHSLENVSDSRSMSLHLYAKPIRNCNVFDEKSKQFVNKNLAYNTCID